MALIQVTPELLNSKATEVRNIRGQHDEAIAKLRTLVQSLNEIWKGEAQDAFVSKYESMQSTFTNFSEMLEGYAVLMDNTAKTMQEADQSLRTGIQNSFS